VEVRNEADNRIYSVEKLLTEHGDKIAEDERKKIQDEIAAAREAMKGGDLDAIRNATQNLVKASQKIGEEMYKKTAGAGAAEAGPTGPTENQENGQPGGPNQERVVDAEYTEVDKDKK
jgi:molecular chaperone DnaK